MNRQLTHYQKAQVDGSSQRDLIVMCYKGGIKYLLDGREKLNNADVAGFSECIERTHRIVFHLYTTLDMNQGGEIAQRLADLYVYMINQLYLLNATKNDELFDGLIRVLTTLKEGWERIDNHGIDGAPLGSRASETNAQVVSVKI